VLAWLFLDETLNGVEIIGLALAAVGIFMANIKKRSEKNSSETPEG
jgi:drug/metabolite transporter (DMT)-like permease